MHMRNDKDDELRALYAECSILRKQLVDAYSEISKLRSGSNDLQFNDLQFNDLRSALQTLLDDK